MFDPTKIVYSEFYEQKIDVIICLSWQRECKERVGFDLLEKYGKDGFAVLYFPIDDFHTPTDMKAFGNVVNKIAYFLQQGCNCVIHCHAGIGRTGLTICCLAKQCLGIGSKEVIPWIRETIRGAVQVHLNSPFYHLHLLTLDKRARGFCSNLLIQQMK